MNWEKVKGFCRRQTQKVNESYRQAYSTKDDESDAGHRRIQTYRRVAQSVAARMDQFNNTMATAIALMESMKEELKLVDVEDVNTTASKLELACLAMRKNQDSLQASLTDASVKLRKYCDECVGIDNMAEDRKAKKLEYDFFKNKLDKLRQHPPSDPARIPRNEARLNEWQAAYDEANDRLKNLAHNLTLQGIRTLSESASSGSVAITKYTSENSNSLRALFGNAGIAATVMSTAQSAAAAAQQQLPRVASAAANTIKASAPLPPPQAAQQAFSQIRDQTSAAFNSSASPNASQANLTRQASVSGQQQQPQAQQAPSQPAETQPSADASPSGAPIQPRVRPPVDDPFAM